MVQATRPANTYSFTQGATTFNISQTLRNLVNSIRNLFSRTLQSICHFLFGATKASQSIQQKVNVVRNENKPKPKLVSKPASRRSEPKAPIKLHDLAPVRQIVAVTEKPSVRVAVPMEEDSHTPTFLKHAEIQVSGTGSERSQEFMETPVRIASPSIELPSLGSTPLRMTSPEPGSMPRESNVELLHRLFGEIDSAKQDKNGVVMSLSFDEVELKIRSEEESDDERIPTLLVPVREGQNGCGIPEDEEKGVGLSNTLRLMRKAEIRAKNRSESDEEPSPRSPRLDQPKRGSRSELAAVFAKSPRLEKPQELICESIYGANGIKANSREAIYFHHVAIPKIFSLFENGEKVNPELLDKANAEGLLLYADSKDDGRPLPFSEFVYDLGGFEGVGKMRFGELSHLLVTLKGSARNLPADAVLGACIFDGDLAKNPQMYTAFIRFDSSRREHDFYLLDPYGDDQNPVISWHVLNEEQFLSHFAKKNYRVMPFKKMLKEDA